MSNNSVCYHCGLPLTKTVFYIEIHKINQPMCCIGCQMVAKTIVDNHLENYYKFRDTKSASQINVIPPELLELNQYDVVDIQQEYLLANESNEQDIHEVILSIDGITCAACIWLLEKRINAFPGILQITINLSNHRAQLRWDNHKIALSSILLDIAKLGFRAYPYSSDKEDISRQHEQRMSLKRLAISGLGFGQVMMFAAPLYSWFSHGIPDFYRDFFRIISLIVTTPVLIYCGLPYFKSGYTSLKSHFLSMDVSISLALITVYLAGVYATLVQSGEVYFDSITMFLFFITLSRYLEQRARHQSNFILDKLKHQQQNWITRIKGADTEVIPINQLKTGDKILVKAGSTIPVDGIIEDGTSSVNESLLTGEALPKMKMIKDAVIAGSQNIENPLIINVLRTGNQTTLATIMKLFERAQYEKPQIISLTQKFSHYFVIIQMLLASSLFIYWAPASIEHAFWISISILVVSCPCALAIATPVALTAAMNALSKYGFLCTRGHILESMDKVTDIVFDKTGTLTEGKFSITNVTLSGSHSLDQVMNIAAALEAKSEHPIASAFKYYQHTSECNNIILHPNHGIEGSINNQCYYFGSDHFIKSKLPQANISKTSTNSCTQVILATENKVLAVFELTDQIRSCAQVTIQYLKEHNYRIHLLSGDNDEAVKHVAQRLKIDFYQGNCTPQEKINYVKSLQTKGAIVAMCGDGINDAPVLMQAHVSIAMMSAADLTRISADAVLMKNDISLLITVMKHVKKTHNIIKQCLCWAIVYNLISLPLAMTGLVAPYVAAVLMSASSILVVANALRLRHIVNTVTSDTSNRHLTLIQV